MITVIILQTLRDDIIKTFKKESLKVYALLREVESNPHKGKVLGHVGNMSIREIRYKNYRFYFILDGHRLYLLSKGLVEELLVKFIRMSKKNNQQQTIDEIKQMLKILAEETKEPRKTRRIA